MPSLSECLSRNMMLGVRPSCHSCILGYKFLGSPRDFSLFLWVFTAREMRTSGLWRHIPSSLRCVVKHRQQAGFIKNLASRLLVEQQPACISNSSKSLSWTRPTALPALRQRGSVQNRRANIYKCVWPLSSVTPLQLEGTRPTVGWDGERGEHCCLNWTPDWRVDSPMSSSPMAKHLASRNETFCLLLLVAVSLGGDVDIVMGFLFCNL